MSVPTEKTAIITTEISQTCRVVNSAHLGNPSIGAAPREKQSDWSNLATPEWSPLLNFQRPGHPEAPCLLDRSQWENYIRRAERVRLGVANQFFGFYLQHGSAAVFDFFAPVGQMGEKIAHRLLHCGTGAQALVAVAS